MKERYVRFFEDDLEEGVHETIGNIVHGIRKTKANFSADGGKSFDKDMKKKRADYSKTQKDLQAQIDKVHAEKKKITAKTTKTSADKKKAKELTKQAKKIDSEMSKNYKRYKISGGKD